MAFPEKRLVVKIVYMDGFFDGELVKGFGFKSVSGEPLTILGKPLPLHCLAVKYAKDLGFEVYGEEA